jgi:hypothetical protein
MKTLFYSNFGAVGDGVTDDFDAIVATHESANLSGATVSASAGATYYIGDSCKTCYIETDTNWTGAKFIIDDTKVDENRKFWVFEVRSKLEKVDFAMLKTLKAGQQKIENPLKCAAFVEAEDENTLRFIRRGHNKNNGAPQTDVFCINEEGDVDPKTPIIWDFDNITKAVAYPIDNEILTIKGGEITQISNTQPHGWGGGFARGIKITRSNVVLDGLKHNMSKSPKPYAPSSFLVPERCANITVKNCVFTAHDIFNKSKGVRIFGGYGFCPERTVNLHVLNCTQTNDIYSDRQWGVFGSNYCKNIVFDGVEFSRFDAHSGCQGVTIINSKIGWQNICAIGGGTLLIENTALKGGHFITLRADYGSVWNGDVVIKNCTFTPTSKNPSLFHLDNDGMHDFGYVCSMPHTVTIDGLHIEDKRRFLYRGVKLFFDQDAAKKPSATYPLVRTKHVKTNGVTTASGRKLRVKGYQN